MGKVPAILHRGELVTEQVAIFIYLADLFPQAGLAPALDDRLRGPYLRWMAYYGSSFEPAVVDRALKREPGPLNMVPYGDYDTMLKTVTDQLAKGPYLLGERMTAADVLWGTALALDHHVQAGPRDAGDHGLREAHDRAAGGRQGE